MELIRNGKTPLLVAHRGVTGGNIPSNSEAAFRAAISLGADVVELDVALSRSGSLFVFHPGMEPAHIGTKKLLCVRSDKSIEKLRYRNGDHTKTSQPVLTLDDALELLRGHCMVNLDKFWTAPAAIADCVRRHGMADDVLIKTGTSEHDLRRVEETAPDMRFLAIVREKDDVSQSLRGRRLRFAGIEALFKTDDAPVVSDDHIAWLHQNGLCIWGNAIVYDERAVIAGTHTDDTAVTGDPDTGWGWYRNKGFDLVQTDHLAAAKAYFERQQHDDV